MFVDDQRSTLLNSSIQNARCRSTGAELNGTASDFGEFVVQSTSKSRSSKRSLQSIRNLLRSPKKTLASQNIIKMPVLEERKSQKENKSLKISNDLSREMLNTASGQPSFRSKMP